MKFGEQIKKLRKDMNITQQEMADMIGISRQAISNWENDKNLPDIEMLITMSQVFHITLDELILGGTQMNNMTEKLIQDGSTNRRISMNLAGIRIGAALLILGVISLIGGIWAPIATEGYFGMAFSIFMLCGVLTFLIVGANNIRLLFKNDHNKTNVKFMAAGGAIVILGLLGYIAGMFMDTNISISGIGIIAIVVGIVLILVGQIKK